MTSKSLFKWRHFLSDIILWGVRWYCSYPISYRQLEETMYDRDRGLEVDHSTLQKSISAAVHI
jgi:transposase-like protein